MNPLSLIAWSALALRQPEPPGWDERLASLEPSRPAAYLELAEEIADAPRAGPATPAGEDAAARASLAPGDLTLARQLLALAFELDRLDGGSNEVAGSACLALADLEAGSGPRRWLLALAGTVDRRRAAPDWTAPASQAASEATALAAATALGYARSGEGHRARELVRDPAVEGLIESYERMLSASGSSGSVFRFRRTIEDWPCPECGNARVVNRPPPGGSGRADGPNHRLCYTCKGNPGPALSTNELGAQLRFEAALLSGIQRSWAAQLTADQGSPLRDPEPEELAGAYGVSASSPLWRDGKWAAR